MREWEELEQSKVREYRVESVIEVMSGEQMCISVMRSNTCFKIYCSC